MISYLERNIMHFMTPRACNWIDNTPELILLQSRLNLISILS